MTVTWLDSITSDHEIVPPSYTIVRKDGDTRAAKVAIALRRGIPYSVMPAVNNVEAICCKRHLTDPLLDYMNSYMPGGRIVIAGDFNTPDVNWFSLSPGSELNGIIVDFLFTFNPTQLVLEPTRMQGESNSALDL